jgi:hypothetical protein
MQADDEIERLVGELRARGDWQRTVLILLSDHSMDTTLQKTNLTSAFEDDGISGDDFVVVQNGSVDMVYLANRNAPGRFALLHRMRERALATDGVHEALYRAPNPEDGEGAHTLDGAHPGWRLAGRGPATWSLRTIRPAPSPIRARSTTRSPATTAGLRRATTSSP